jgi:DNA replication protein DnaC
VSARVKLFTTPCLVVDDVGTELAADRPVMSAALVALLNKRSSKRTRTLLTFNGDKHLFREQYADERLHSRLAQLGAFVVDVGPDMRRHPPV